MALPTVDRNHVTPTGERLFEFHARLRKEARWSEAKSIYDRYRADGNGYYDGWDLTTRHFQLKQAQEYAPATPIACPREAEPAHWKSAEISGEEVVRWVFENIQRMDVQPAEAPSAGAWGLWKGCRGDPKNAWEFMSKVWLRGVRFSDEEQRAAVDKQSRFLEAEAVQLGEFIERIALAGSG